MLFQTARTFDNIGNHVRRINKSSLPDKVFDDSLMHIDDSIKYSTKIAFKKQAEFYDELTPRLRSKLI